MLIHCLTVPRKEVTMPNNFKSNTPKLSEAIDERAKVDANIKRKDLKEAVEQKRRLELKKIDFEARKKKLEVENPNLEISLSQASTAYQDLKKKISGLNKVINQKENIGNIESGKLVELKRIRDLKIEEYQKVTQTVITKNFITEDDVNTMLEQEVEYIKKKKVKLIVHAPPVGMHTLMPVNTGRVTPTNNLTPRMNGTFGVAIPTRIITTNNGVSGAVSDTRAFNVGRTENIVANTNMLNYSIERSGDSNLYYLKPSKLKRLKNIFNEKETAVDKFNKANESWNANNELLENTNISLNAEVKRLPEIQAHVDKINGIKLEIDSIQDEVEKIDGLIKPFQGTIDLIDIEEGRVREIERKAFPTLLLPLRLEAKYIGPKLKVRIFPDQVHAYTHAQKLKKSELEVLIEYEEAKDELDQQELVWRDMVDQFGERRSRWIIKQAKEVPKLKQDLGALPSDGNDDFIAKAACLPKSWMAVGYKNGKEVIRSKEVIITAKGELDLFPTAENEDWIRNYETAINKGMAVELSYNKPLDLLVAVGIQDSPDDSVSLGDLMNAHQYTDGISFPKTGMATNVEEGMDEDPSVFDVKKSHETAISEEEGHHKYQNPGNALTSALGLDENIINRIDGANDKWFEGGKRSPVANMNALLWPVTWQYFFKEMVGVDDKSEETKGNLTDLSKHFEEFVRPNGPLPNLVVGNQPYGVLPIAKLDLESEGFVGLLAGQLDVLRNIWSESVSNREERSNEFSDMEPINHGFSLRELYDVNNLPYGALPNTFFPKFEEIMKRSLNQSMLNFLPPLVLSMFGDFSPPLFLGLVCNDGELSEDEVSEGEEFPEYSEYIRHIAGASIDDILLSNINISSETLLAELLIASQRSYYIELVREKIFINLDDPDENKRRENRINLKNPDFFKNEKTEIKVKFSDFNKKLKELSELPSANLDRIFRQAMDTCSHRLDAWITSVATRRLDEIREVNTSNKIRVGAYGWLENLLPDKEAVKAKGGWIHAPSIDQAAAAGIIKSAQLGSPSSGLLDVDLSSKRVRAALQLLEGVREGVNLSTLLGYRLERRMRKYEFGKYISVLRDIAPLIVDKEFRHIDTPSESLGAFNIVDGLAIISAKKNWVTKNITEISGRPPHDKIVLRGNDKKAIENHIDELQNEFDALSDLLKAEGVYQHVKGNSTRAGAVFSAGKNGEHIPESIEVVKTMRQGIQHSQSLYIIENTHESDAVETPVSSDKVEMTRAIIEPTVNRWCEKMLRSLVSGLTKITYDSDRQITVEDLNIAPIDFVYMATDEFSFVDEIRKKIELLEPKVIVNRNSIKVTYKGDLIELNVLFEVCKSLREIISAAKPLNENDFPSLKLDYDDSLRKRKEILLTELIRDRGTLETSIETVKSKLTTLTEIDFLNEDVDVLCKALMKMSNYNQLETWSGNSSRLEYYEIRIFLITQTNRLINQIKGMTKEKFAVSIGDISKKVELISNIPLKREDKEALDNKALIAQVNSMANHLSKVLNPPNPTEIRTLVECLEGIQRIINSLANKIPESVPIAYNGLFAKLQDLNKNINKIVVGVVGFDTITDSAKSLLDKLKELQGELNKVHLELGKFNEHFVKIEGVIKNISEGDADSEARADLQQMLTELREFIISSLPLIQGAGAVVETSARTTARFTRFEKNTAEPYNPIEKNDLLIEQIKSVLGKDFIVLPTFKLTKNEEADWLISDKGVGTKEHSVETWVRRSSMVRESIAKFDRARINASIFNNNKAVGSFHVMQLPLKINDVWISQNDSYEDHEQRNSIVIHASGEASEGTSLNFEGSIAGMKIDSWEEVVPFKQQETGLAFNYNAPNTEAPNTILLAVPNKGETLDIEDLATMVKETNELAKIRMVDLQSLKGLGHFLPAIYFPQHPKNETQGSSPQSSERNEISRVHSNFIKSMHRYDDGWSN